RWRVNPELIQPCNDVLVTSFAGKYQVLTLQRSANTQITELFPPRNEIAVWAYPRAYFGQGLLDQHLNIFLPCRLKQGVSVGGGEFAFYPLVQLYQGLSFLDI